MAYVPGFEYDLFISYSSDDLDPKLQMLISELRVYLRRELGKEFSSEHGIFFDRQELNLTPVQWKQKLHHSARSAAILIPVLTPSWASSEYCAKEWEWFRENHPLEWQAGSETVYRVCPLHWRTIDPELLHQVDPGIRAAQEQRSLTAEELGAKLANGLRMLRRSRQTIYLGESEHDTRAKVREELTRMGLRVMPESAMAYGSHETVKELLGKAQIAIHFAGGQSKQRALDAIQSSLEYCQHATIVYELPGVDLAAEEDLWLEMLAVPASRIYDRISGKTKNLDQFLQALKDRLEGPPPLSATQIGIACEPPDNGPATSIVADIQNRTGFTVVCHGSSLLDFKKSRGLLLYWGAAEGKHLRKWPIAIRTDFSFFLAPPPKPKDAQATIADMPVLQQSSERFQIEDIRPFLERLGWKS